MLALFIYISISCAREPKTPTDCGQGGMTWKQFDLNLTTVGEREREKAIEEELSS